MLVSDRPSTAAPAAGRVVSAALLGLALGSLGCNAIFSMDERTPYPPGHGGAGADGGSGAATSSGGSAGSGGSGAGPVGGGGTGGTAGSGGSGGDPCVSPEDPGLCLPREGCLSAEHCSDVMLLLHFDRLEQYAEGDDYAKDFSGHDNDATCDEGTTSGCPTFDAGAGRFAGAYLYSPDQHFTVQDSSSLSLPDVLTVAAWFRPQTLQNTWRPIVAKATTQGEDANFWLGHNGASFCVLFNPIGGDWENECSGSFAANQWYLLVGTWDDPNDRFQIYVNGEFLTDRETTADMPNVEAPVNIGWTSGDNGVDGWIDEVIIWNRLLSNTEIQALYPD